MVIKQKKCYRAKESIREKNSKSKKKKRKKKWENILQKGKGRKGSLINL